MQTKLFLNEDDAEMIVAEPVEEKPIDKPVEGNELSLSNLINQMIKGEWDAIDLYNAVSLTVKEDPKQENKDIILDTIKDITEEEYIHVGQLEKLLQFFNGSAEKIADGQEEAEGDISNDSADPSADNMEKAEVND